MRRVCDDGAGFWRDGGGDFVEVGAKGAGRQGRANRHAAGQLDVGHVAVVTRLQHDDFVTRMDDRQNGGDDRLGRPGRNGNFAGSAVFPAMQPPYFCRNGVAQHWHAGHGRVLVQALLHGVGHHVDQMRITVEIGKALPKVDGILFSGQGGHDGEDGGANLGQFGLKRRGGWVAHKSF